MVLHTGPRQTEAEVRQQNIDNNAAYATLFHQSLEGIHHFKELAKPTKKIHDLMIRRWKEYAEAPDGIFPDGRPVSAVITPGATLPSLNQIKHFLVWMWGSMRGHLEKHVTVVTAITNIHTFWAVWRQEAFIATPKDLRIAINCFVYSKELRAAVPLSTRSREKQATTDHDIFMAVSAAWRDRVHFRTHRMRMQFILVLFFCSITAARIGSVIESGCYTGTNECIYWEDVEIHIKPNPDDPAHPIVFIMLTLHFLKGKRKNESQKQSVFLVPEPASRRACCPAMMLISMALQDGALEHIDTVEQIFSPKVSPTSLHRLSIRSSSKKQPIFRAEVYGASKSWTISETDAYPYSAYCGHLRWLSNVLGLPEPIRAYDTRRGAARLLSRMVSETERQAQLTHATEGMYLARYHGNVSTLDLQGLARTETQDAAVVRTLRESQAVTARANPNAPVRLSLTARNELEAEPELMALSEKIEKARELVRDCDKALFTSRDASEKNAISAARRQYRELSSKLQTQYARMFEREARYLHEREREAFFQQQHSKNQILGITDGPTNSMGASSSAAPLIRGSAYISPLRVASLQSRESNIPITNDPMHAFVNLLYESEENVSEHIISAVNAYLALPSRPFEACYPEQCPTDKNKCPVCDEECNAVHMNRKYGGVGAHIHDCLRTLRQKEAQALANHLYQPRSCPWAGCRQSSKIWQTRDTFVSHCMNHIHQANKRTVSADIATCLWTNENGETCDERHLHLADHIAREHCTNLSAKISVKYCFICSEWFDDVEGTMWDSHCTGHYLDLFLPFSERAGSLQVQPEGITCHPDNNTITFANGSGFAGRYPEFHGEVQNGIVCTPMFCPFCVFNESISMEKRVHQFWVVSVFIQHLRAHLNPASHDNYTPAACPVPSCGTHIFPLAYDILYHMVTVHRVPICGSMKHTTQRRIRLPDPGPLKSSGASNARTKRALPQILDRDADETSETSIPASKKQKQTRNKIRGKCAGCYVTLQDIDGHFATVPEGSKCLKKLSYQPIINNSPTAKVDWVCPPGMEINRGARSLGDRMYYCTGCRGQFMDIRDHFPDPPPDNPLCSNHKFKIRVAGKKRSTWGEETLFFDDWIKTAPARTTAQLKPFKCNSCYSRFADIQVHFQQVQLASKCRKGLYSTLSDDGTWVVAQQEAGGSGSSSL